MNRVHLLTALLAAVLSPLLDASAHEDEQIPQGAPDRLGEVSFPVSCSPAAQVEFNRAMAMLHSFFYPEAGRTFARASAIDPSCAMGHWGVAMSWWYPLWYPPTRESFVQGKAALERATAVGGKTERERAYIAALARFYGDFDRDDHRSRALAYEKAMSDVHARFPEDREAGLLYALALQATADPNDKTYANQLESARILEQVFAEQPNHPGAAHYLIHAYDYPELAPRALPAARRYGAIAPAMPHALHMPSHTFIAVGLWQDSIRSNLAAGAVAHQLGWAQEELHTMDYLVYAYLQGAQAEAAMRVVDRLADVSVDDKARTLPVDYALAAAPARLALEQRRWGDAATLAPRASRFPATQALTHFARALGAAHAGKLQQGEQEIARLTQIRDALGQSKQDYWAKQVEVQRQTARAWLAWASGDTARAVETMRAAVELEESTYKHPITPGQLLPARELMGDLLLDVGQPGAALTEYEATLRLNPNRFNALYGAARAAELAGHAPMAATYYRQLLELCGSADAERPELRHARLFLATG
jgi:tetratricopeptide (TPR) repeat protein